MNLQFIKSDFPGAKRGQHVYFRFKDNEGCIELKFGTPQEKDTTGWTIDPHIKPCRVSIIVLCMVDIIILYILSLNSYIAVMLIDSVKLIILFLHLA